VNKRLVRRDFGLIQLFDPPFDKSGAPIPVNIKGYIPGVRRTAANTLTPSIWTAMAFAVMGESERAVSVLAAVPRTPGM